MLPRHPFAKDQSKFLLFRLAEQIGGTTVAELRARIGLTEAIEWIGYWKYSAALRDQAIEQAKMAK
jgi:hypothetical protein